jgi:pimeloyl-ACP methyl ester carboxylesterase
MTTLVSSSGTLTANGQPIKPPTYYRSITIDGLSIFYREAGPKDGPTILLLHGLPSSSRMFQPLFDRLADRYHLVAPDYRDSAIATGRIRSNSRTRSTATPRS